MVERAPTLDEVREAHRALWRLSVEGTSRKWPAIVQEDEYLALVGRVVDTLAPIRAALDHFEGWPHVLGRAFRVSAAKFDALIESWGWQRLAVPEPARSAEAARCREAFDRKYLDPLCAAALAIQASLETVEGPPHVDHFAEHGRRRGLAPAVPVPTHEAYRELVRGWADGLAYGRVYPTHGLNQDKEWCQALHAEAAILKAADPARPLRPWRPAESEGEGAKARPPRSTPPRTASPPDRPRDPLTPPARALAAAYELHKEGKPVSLKAACDRAKVDPQNLRERHHETVQAIRAIGTPDRAPRRGIRDRRTGGIDAVEDDED